MRIRLGRRAKGEVEAFLDEVHQASAEIDVEAHVRITGPVVGQYADEDTFVHPHRRGQLQDPARRHDRLADGGLDLLQSVQHLPRSKYSAPVSIRLTRRLVRLKRRVGRRCSRWATCLLAMAGDRPSRSAANAQAHQGVHRIVNSQEMLHQRNSR